ncbi:MAG: type II secretion system protein, partial [Lachnospiraceae bacterium]|nr:type II secretion system protein [Lachnospiraceae bacterium]
MDSALRFSIFAALKKYKNTDRKKGFTLVELIVVLVILAVLAAILVPALLGYIDKSRQARYILEARECVNATTTVIVEQYASGSLSADTAASFLNDDTKEAILTLAEVDGSIISLELSDSSLTVYELYYQASDGTIV